MEEKKRSYDTIRNHLKKCFETLRIPPLEVESGPSKEFIYNTVEGRLGSDFNSLPDYTRIAFDSEAGKFTFIPPYIESSVTPSQIV